eukprot:247435_1
MLRGDSKYARNLLAVPSYRHYIRNKRASGTRRSTTSNSWLPSCKCFVASLYTVLAVSFMIYLKSTAARYTHHWTHAKLSDNHKVEKFKSIQHSLQQWLNKYPSIKPHRAHDGFTCDSWNCQPTFDVSSDQWITPRKQYILTDKPKYHQWINTHNLQNKQLMDSKQQCEYIFIGDSISYSWNYYPNIFNKYFNQNNNGMIYAQSGDKIHEIGWRLKNKQGNGFKKLKHCLLNGNAKQKSIILLIGTNDIGAGSTYDVALNDYMILLQQLLEFMIDINKHINVMLYVMGIFPRGETYVSFADRQKKKDTMSTFEDWNVDNKYFYSVNFMNDYLKYFADNNVNGNIKYIDCNENLFDDNNKNMVEFKDKKGVLHEYRTGAMSIDIMEDMLHLTEKGYDRWSNCILQHITSSN